MFSFFSVPWIRLTALGILAGLIASATVAVKFHINEYDRRGSEIVKLNNALKTREGQIRVLESQQALDRTSLKILDDRLKALPSDLDKQCALLDAVKKSKDANADKPVDEILGDLLEQLEKQ